jgi:SAM-dependent methyltransferase
VKTAPLRGTDSDLYFARRKPHSIGLSITWRMLQLYRRVFGPERLLRLTLDGHWLLRRMAHELGIELMGDEFYWRATALDPERLAAWIPQGASVIDVGCGVGRLSRAVAGQASTVVGIDHDETQIALARRLTVESNVEFFVGDVTGALPRPLVDRRFDMALLIAVLEHVDDAPRLLVALHRIAAGLIVEVPSIEADPLNFIRRRLGSRFYSDPDHVREYTLTMLAQELTAGGWRIAELRQAAGNLLARAEPA